jgi:hypothetical protein
MSTDPVLHQLLVDIDKMLRKTDALRGSLIQLRRTLNNPQDPHYHISDVHDLHDYATDMEFEASWLSKQLKDEKRLRKHRRRITKKR